MPWLVWYENLYFSGKHKCGKGTQESLPHLKKIRTRILQDSWSCTFCCKITYLQQCVNPCGHDCVYGSGHNCVSKEGAGVECW